MLSIDRALRIVALLLLVPLSGFAQDPDYVLTLPDATVVGGEVHDQPLLLTNTGDPIAGFSLGTCNDPALLQITDIAFGEALQALNGGDGPDFFSYSFFDDGFVCGTVISLTAMETVGQAIDAEAVVMTYQTFPSPPTSTEIEFCNTQGNPIVEITIVNENGMSIVPTTVDATIDFVDALSFVRGDVDATASITIADPIVLLIYMFQSGSVSCEMAADVNGDDGIDLPDALHLLMYINGLGPAPAAPFPDCAPATSSVYSCDSFGACP